MPPGSRHSLHEANLPEPISMRVNDACRIPHEAWWSAGLGCARYVGVEPLFKETGCRAMRLETLYQMK